MPPNWSTFLSELEPKATFNAPASAEDLQRLERFFNVQLPDDLRSFLEQSDGVEGAHGLGLVWPGARIITDNKTFRTNEDFRKL